MRGTVEVGATVVDVVDVVEVDVDVDVEVVVLAAGGAELVVVASESSLPPHAASATLTAPSVNHLRIRASSRRYHQVRSERS
jgi:hypothetical protein